jgi:hypothetical protein
MGDENKNEFERAAGQQSRGLLSEFWYLLSQNKKWWIIPILIPLLVFGVLMLLAGTGAAPFIYTLF